MLIFMQFFAIICQTNGNHDNFKYILLVSNEFFYGCLNIEMVRLSDLLIYANLAYNYKMTKKLLLLMQKKPETRSKIKWEEF